VEWNPYCIVTFAFSCPNKGLGKAKDLKIRKGSRHLDKGYFMEFGKPLTMTGLSLNRL
jgi:hypothetical protein